MNRIFSRLPSLASTLFLLVICATTGVVLLTQPRHIGGWQFMAVRSGSMEPTLPTGSLLLVKAEAGYQINDIVTFRHPQQSQQLITHRIVGEGERGGGFRVKGDANPSPDLYTVNSEHIVGKVWRYFPILGYILTFLKTPLGVTLFVVIPGTILIYEEMRSVHRTLHQRHKTGAATSLFLIGVLSLSVTSTWAVYTTNTTVSEIQLATTRWLTPLLTATTASNSVNIHLDNGSGITTLQYKIRYQHQGENNPIMEELMGEFTKPATTNTYSTPDIYLGTCSETECVPHTGINQIELTVTLLNGDQNITSTVVPVLLGTL